MAPSPWKSCSATASRHSGGHAVAIDGLTKTYPQPKAGTFNAVDNLSLHISRGETYALLGPNGAGKSTTIEIMEGPRKPSAGTVSVLGHRPYKAPASFRATQSALAPIGDTARENLAEARALIESAGSSQLKGGDLLGALQRLKGPRRSRRAGSGPPTASGTPSAQPRPAGCRPAVGTGSADERPQTCPGGKSQPAAHVR